jgi:fused signal recognition particle receptor
MSDPPKKRPGFFKKLRARLNRGDSWLTYDVAALMPGKRAFDEAALDEFEEQLLLADVGFETSEAITAKLRVRGKQGKIKTVDDFEHTLADTLYDILAPVEQPLEITLAKPFVLLVVGVNGTGKTTTIGKLAQRFKDQDLTVMLAAGDTFRAAAVEQLQRWGERVDVPVIAQKTGADPAAVVHDAVHAARARGADLLIVDTAGRLHTQANLMEELKKIRRVLNRLDQDAPHEVLLVLDAGTGQNVLRQIEQFNSAVDVTGLAITKLDGTARAGILFAAAKQYGLPVRFIGIGEAVDDLAPFEARAFVEALLDKSKEEIADQ